MQAAPQISFAVTLGLKELRAAGRFGDIKSLLFEELQRELQELNEPSYRAGQITDWLYKKRAGAFEEMTDLPQPLRARLVERFSIG